MAQPPDGSKNNVRDPRAGQVKGLASRIFPVYSLNKSLLNIYSDV